MSPLLSLFLSLSLCVLCADTQVDPDPYYQACVLEACSCEFEGKFLGFCTAVAAYAEACSEQNVCIQWRTPDLCREYCSTGATLDDRYI